MLYEPSYKIAERFWIAFDVLRDSGGRGWEYNFIKEVGTNIGNFRKLKSNYARSFELGYIQYIVEKYNVSSEWIITGKGEMFCKKKGQAGRFNLFEVMIN